MERPIFNTRVELCGARERMWQLAEVSETATIRLLKTWTLEEPLVAKFHATGYSTKRIIDKHHTIPE